MSDQKKKYIIWGADWLGQQMLKYLSDRGENIICFWDKIYLTLKSILGYPVKEPLNDYKKDDYRILLGMGNVYLREKLRKLAKDAGYHNLMPEESLRKNIHKNSICQKIEFPISDSEKKYSIRERLAAGIDFAADSDYAAWCLQQQRREKERAAGSLFYYGSDGYKIYEDEYIRYQNNNGLDNVRGIIDSFQIFIEKPNLRDDSFVVFTRTDQLHRSEKERTMLVKQEAELDDLGIEHCRIEDLEWSVYDGHISRSVFGACKKSALQIFDLLSDDESKRVYAETILNRIAPQYASCENFELKSHSIQYFDKEIVPEKFFAYFVDGGAYTGDTLKELFDNAGSAVEKAYVFEFDPENLKELKKTVSACGYTNKTEIIEKGISDKSAKINLEGSGLLSRISDSDSDGNTEIVPLDEELSGRKVTYIKMDIEGAEKEALQGAESIIRNQRPVLAICCYHHIEDMWQVPLMVLSMVQDYKVYFRHYTDYQTDTVCYMIPVERNKQTFYHSKADTI